MQSKQVNSYATIKEKILNAVDTLNDPIRQTLSPRGGNVIYEDERGLPNVTNDGATIAKFIHLEDPIENMVVELIKHAAFRTNTQAGDGTSSTVLLSSTLIKGGLKLVENGFNPMELKREFDSFAEQMVEKLQKLSKPIKDDKDLFYIAKVSASGDKEIADIVVKTVKTAGEDGMVFIEPSNTKETEIVEDTGFNIASGLFTPELVNNRRAMNANYLNVPVLITDKRLYYPQEAETILNVALKNGYTEIVVVAKDFIGEALPYFVANHTKGSIRVLLVKEPNVDKNHGETLEDLAIYLGGHVVSDKSGSIVDNLQIEDFVIAKKAFADGGKTIISRDRNEENKELDNRIAALKKMQKKHGKEENSESRTISERLASLTNGVVTVRIGGNTPLEVNEKIYRYEDAVNATRAAMKDGYLVGGGVSIWRAWQQCKFKGDTAKLYRQVAEAGIRQIAENCGMNGDIVIDTLAQVVNPNAGFNALTMTYGDLLDEGVIDPYKVTEMAIRNAASVAGMVVSSRYFINTIVEKENGKS